MKSSLSNYLITLSNLKKELVKNIQNKKGICNENQSLSTIISTIKDINTNDRYQMADQILLSLNGESTTILASIDDIIVGDNK